MPARIAETELYAPIKAYLERLGYEVKSEVGPVDVVGRREDADPVIVELKVGFSLVLLQQAVARQAICDAVYVAVPRWTTQQGWLKFKANVGLCKRLGIGVLTVRVADGHVQLHADPIPYQPRKSRRRAASVLSEFERRIGDPNLGGTQGSVVTSYRQAAQRCAAYLVAHGPSKGSVVAKALGVANATRVMADNHYGWFRRVTRGVYGVTREGREAGT
ncbi:MAG: DUF2161 domain-containing phosphodiesterase [Nannocystales bacterium]